MIKVLVVEDEDLIRQGLKLTTTWSDFGSEIIGEAADGEEGREMILRLKPDLVITDIKMPKLSGLEMIESLQDEISCEYIILSGYDEFAYAKRAMRMGVRGYFCLLYTSSSVSGCLRASSCSLSWALGLCRAHPDRQRDRLSAASSSGSK